MIDETYRGFRLRSDPLGGQPANVRITPLTSEASAVMAVHVVHWVGKRTEPTPEAELVARFKAWVDEKLPA